MFKARTTTEALSILWAKTTPPMPGSGCMEWTGHKNKGYGSFRGFWGTAAHQFAAFAAGMYRPPGMFVCHRCNNPACCNPYHLYVGTHQQNMDDRRGRGLVRPESAIRRGSRALNARLNEEMVREILSSPLRNCELARKLGVAKESIYQVRRRITWKHVTI